MKQIFVTLVFLLGMMCSTQAQTNKQTVTDNQPHTAKQVKKAVATTSSSSVTVVSNTTDAEMARIDSLIQAKVNKLTEKKVEKEVRKWKQRYGVEIKSEDTLFKLLKETKVMGIIVTILFCGFPLILLGIILYFRYKSKKAKYEVMKQALACGKNLPSDFTAKEIIAPITGSNYDILWRKGIKTFFLGLGIAFFLGFLTNSELSSIGILIMCIGAGQIVLAWFPSASYVKNVYNKSKQKEMLWEEQPGFHGHNSENQKEKTETKDSKTSIYAPKEDKNETEEINSKAGTDVINAQTKEEIATDTTTTGTNGSEENPLSDRENSPSDTNKE